MHDQSSARYPFLISYVWVGKGWKFIHLKKWPEILKPLHVNNGQGSVLSLAGVIMERTSLLWFAYQFFLHFNVFSALKEGLQCVERVDCQAIFVCTIIYYIEYRANVRSSHQDYFRKYLFFSSRSTFFWSFQEALCVHRTDANFPGRFVCSPNRYHFSRSPLYVFTEQIPIFQKHFFSYRTDTNFPGALFMCSPNRYQFSRSTFLATEQIQIFQEHILFGYRTDTDFPWTPF